jgi:prepilin-type N-terminal cleavage/methylation domain-containing protein
MTRGRQQGFTLVEIGVVLIIIGLLLAAVLKGQELIASAQVNKLIRDMTGYKAAITIFQDRYRMMPGDSTTAATTVGNGAVNCFGWCDDGVISFPPEMSLANNHLLAAGLYSGPAVTAPARGWPNSEGYLLTHAGGPIFLHYTAGYLTPSGQEASWGTGWRNTVQTSGKLSSKFLGEVDRRVDDGNGWTGDMRAATHSWGFGGEYFDTGACVNGQTGVWIENNPGKNCAAADILAGSLALGSKSGGPPNP